MRVTAQKSDRMGEVKHLGVGIGARQHGEAPRRVFGNESQGGVKDHLHRPQVVVLNRILGLSVSDHADAGPASGKVLPSQRFGFAHLLLQPVPQLLLAHMEHPLPDAHIGAQAKLQCREVPVPAAVHLRQIELKRRHPVALKSAPLRIIDCVRDLHLAPDLLFLAMKDHIRPYAKVRPWRALTALVGKF
ncbi:hypothetical protein SDC9_91227 [bioreactor metagenome]|uniref:Uncharacterized protein n=1 Tax=bioreactor metagenome TaxID=1076179 RepID=A0A644ZU65_9ZZZZ